MCVCVCVCVCAPQLLSQCSRARKAQLMSPHTATPEAYVPRACAPQKRTHHTEKPAECKEGEPPLTVTRESPYTAMKTQHCCCVASVVSDSLRPQRRPPTRLPRPWDSPGKNTGVGCHFLLQCMKVKSESEVAQSCPTLK